MVQEFQNGGTSPGRTRPEVLAHTRFVARKAELEGLPN
jgi:hypothetical protein